MTAEVWLDGELMPSEEARIPALSRAVLYGEGLFETLRTYGGVPFGWEAHLERLRRSSRELGLPIPPTLARVRDAVPRLLARNALADGVLRLSLLAGEGEGGHAGRAERSHLLLHARALPAGLEEERRSGVSAITVRSDSPPSAGHKSSSYLRSVLAARRLAPGGAREALFVDERGRLLEGAASNVLILEGRRLVTPPADGRILSGVTRALVLELAPSLGLEPSEADIEVARMERADALLITSSVIEVLRVSSIDGKAVGGSGPNAALASLQRAYRELVRRETGWGEAVR